MFDPLFFDAAFFAASYRANATVRATSILRGSARHNHQASATVRATGSLRLNPHRRVAASAALHATSFLYGAPRFTASVALRATGVLRGTPRFWHTPSATLRAVGALHLNPRPQFAARATLRAVGGLRLTPRVIPTTAAQMRASARMVVDALVTRFAQVQGAATAAMFAQALRELVGTARIHATSRAPQVSPQRTCFARANARSVGSVTAQAKQGQFYSRATRIVGRGRVFATANVRSVARAVAALRGVASLRLTPYSMAWHYARAVCAARAALRASGAVFHLVPAALAIRARSSMRAYGHVLSPTPALVTFRARGWTRAYVHVLRATPIPVRLFATAAIRGRGLIPSHRTRVPTTALRGAARLQVQPGHNIAARGRARLNGLAQILARAIRWVPARLEQVVPIRAVSRPVVTATLQSPEHGFATVRGTARLLARVTRWVPARLEQVVPIKAVSRSAATASMRSAAHGFTLPIRAVSRVIATASVQSPEHGFATVRGTARLLARATRWVPARLEQVVPIRAVSRPTIAATLQSPEHGLALAQGRARVYARSIIWTRAQRSTLVRSPATARIDTGGVVVPRKQVANPIILRGAARGTAAAERCIPYWVPAAVSIGGAAKAHVTATVRSPLDCAARIVARTRSQVLAHIRRPVAITDTAQTRITARMMGRGGRVRPAASTHRLRARTAAKARITPRPWQPEYRMRARARMGAEARRLMRGNMRTSAVSRAGATANRTTFGAAWPISAHIGMAADGHGVRRGRAKLETQTRIRFAEIRTLFERPDPPRRSFIRRTVQTDFYRIAVK